MKQQFFRLLTSITMIIVFTSLSFAQLPTTTCRAIKVSGGGANQFIFSIYLKNTSGGTIELSGEQLEFDFNSAILNGGTGTLAITGSGLPTSLQLKNPVVVTTTTPGQLRTAAPTPPGVGNGYLIINGDSVLLAKFQLTTTASTLTSDPPNVVFRVATSGNPFTKITAYITTVNTEIESACTFINFGILHSTFTWQSVVNVKDNGNVNQDLTMGTAPTATNGIDLALGELTLPPAPPAGIFDTRFELPNLEASLKDYRNDTLQSISWLMKFQPGAGGYPFTITWNPASLPQGSFFLKDNVTGAIVNVDMKSQSSYSLTNTGISALKIEFSKQLCKYVPVTAGWNIVSVPLSAANMGTTVLFPTGNSPAYGFNNGYQTVTTMSNGKGYWLRFPDSATVTICGSQLGNTISLVSGWNLLGVYSTNLIVSNITTTPAGIINSPFYGYSNGYVVPTTLTSGKGYWVRTSQAGVINTGTVAKSTETIQPNIEKDWAKITVTDATSKSQTLYLAANLKSEILNLKSFDLPPVPPAGIFDVRYYTQRSAELLGTESKQIQISGAEYPVEIRVEGIELRITDLATNGKLVNEFIQGNGSIRINDPKVTAVEVQANIKPTSYELSQNYPNPFNPTTSIKFGLPENANVTLTIYNQIGERVVVLASGALEAGYHTITWNAANQASGIYFYELRTEKFTSVKKLILLK